MDKDTIEFITYKEVADAIKIIRKYCYKQLGCSLQEAVEQFDKWCANYYIGSGVR